MSRLNRPFLILFASLGLTVFAINSGRAFDLYESRAALPMPADPLYVKECGSCHTAYAPGFLPVRSWQQVMRGLEKHFGEDASLDEPQAMAILRWLSEGAADSVSASDLMRRISQSIPAQSPIRITETYFFRYMHEEVPAAIWKRRKIGSPANCSACHPRANVGIYGESEVRVPKN